MVAGHITMNRKAMAVIKAFGEGDFNAPMEQLPGKKAFINETIEQVRTNLKALIADTGMLARAASEGRLDTRADETRRQGDFRVIVDGINKTLDAVIGPMTAVSEVMKAVEEGDLSKTVTHAYCGQLEDLRQAVNSTVASLAETFGEVGRVLRALEEGDLTQSITTPYRGEFERMRVATNSTVARLAQTVTETLAATDQMANASTQIGRASQSLSQAAAEQAASVEETTGVGQINTAMKQMNEITQQNASSSEELAATADEMTGQTNTLQTLMSFFTTGKTQHPRGETVSAAASSGGNGNGRKVLVPAQHTGSAVNGVDTKFSRF
jgi:methyl-accepting chemotaxis protein